MIFPIYVVYIQHLRKKQPKFKEIEKKYIHLQEIKKKTIMDIGKKLRQKRECKNLTQQEVADYVGVERTTYINWEAGTSDVKCKYIPKLSEFLNVDVRELVMS